MYIMPSSINTLGDKTHTITIITGVYMYVCVCKRDASLGVTNPYPEL